jgi:hypothetical protein
MDASRLGNTPAERPGTCLATTTNSLVGSGMPLGMPDTFPRHVNARTGSTGSVKKSDDSPEGRAWSLSEIRILERRINDLRARTFS